MKGCIIKNNKITIKEVFHNIKEAEKSNWLITNIECYPRSQKIQKIFDGEYCWLTGKELLEIMNQEEFQWIWGIFSAFQKEIEQQVVLKYCLPYADGYVGFWENPITIQHPLASSEIVAWDGSLLLAISKQDEIITALMEQWKEVQDLEEYNRKVL